MNKNGTIVIDEDGSRDKSGEKPSWLLTAQKIYPMSDDEYYRMLKSAERSAKIQLNMLNAFTAPAYQKRCVKNVGEMMVVDAAIALRNCQSVIQKRVEMK